MRIGGPRFLGSLLLVGATAACTGPVDPTSPERGDVAIASYGAPDGAPAFCRLLADSVHIDDLPLALGTLTADPEDRAAVAQVEEAHAELEDVLADIADEQRHTELSAALDDLLTAVRSATDDPVDEDLRTRISARLDRFGALVQPVCVFPA
jgi:hypothetical protein